MSDTPKPATKPKPKWEYVSTHAPEDEARIAYLEAEVARLRECLRQLIWLAENSL